jgi:hypothetical protein
MKEKSRIRRYAILSLAFVVAALTFAIVGKAAQTVTVPNAANITYNLAAGAYSGPITPVANQAVLMIGSQTTPGYRGVASATLLHAPCCPNFIEWVGLESPSINGSAITQGFSATAGTHILYLDYSDYVDVQVASADTIRIHNANPYYSMTGNLELIW